MQLPKPTHRPPVVDWPTGGRHSGPKNAVATVLEAGSASTTGIASSKQRLHWCLPQLKYQRTSRQLE